MKLRLLILIILLSFPVVGDVSWEILEISKDSRTGAVMVKTQYKVDGVEVASNYPKLDGKSYWVVRFKTADFAAMTDTQVQATIRKQVVAHAKQIIRSKFIEAQNVDVITNRLGALVGSTGVETSVTIDVDTDGDRTNDKRLTAKTDGTSTSANI